MYFPRTGHTKLDMVRYYLAVADGALGGVGGRPMALKRFVNGAESEPLFQKRAPEKRPDWVRSVELRFPSGQTADEVVVDDEVTLACAQAPAVTFWQDARGPCICRECCEARRAGSDGMSEKAREKRMRRESVMRYQAIDSRSSRSLQFTMDDQLGDAPDAVREFRSAHGILYGLDSGGPVYVGQF